MVVALVAYVTQIQPAQAIDEYTADAWFDILGDAEATFEDLKAAAVAVAKAEPWIYPSAILAELKTIQQRAEPVTHAPAIGQIAAWQAVGSEARLERIARGLEKCRAEIATRTPYRDDVASDSTVVPETLRKAREVALAYKAQQRRRLDPQSLGEAGGRALAAIDRARGSRTT